jgi:hypothetical protein
MAAKTFDVASTLANARAGTLSLSELRKAIKKTEEWGLDAPAGELKDVLRRQKLTTRRRQAVREDQEGGLQR